MSSLCTFWQLHTFWQRQQQLLQAICAHSGVCCHQARQCGTTHQTQSVPCRRCHPVGICRTAQAASTAHGQQHRSGTQHCCQHALCTAMVIPVTGCQGNRQNKGLRGLLSCCGAGALAAAAQAAPAASQDRPRCCMQTALGRASLLSLQHGRSRSCSTRAGFSAIAMVAAASVITSNF